MVYLSEDGHYPLQVLTGSNVINFIDQTNIGNHNTALPTKVYSCVYVDFLALACWLDEIRRVWK